MRHWDTPWLCLTRCPVAGDHVFAGGEEERVDGGGQDQAQVCPGRDQGAFPM